MDLYTINYIKNNPLIYEYLRRNSSWYKNLNRDRTNIKELELAAKKYYKLTLPDKIERFTNQIEMISTFMDVLK